MTTNNFVNSENSEKSLVVYRVPKAMPINAFVLLVVRVRATRTWRVFYA